MCIELPSMVIFEYCKDKIAKHNSNNNIVSKISGYGLSLYLDYTLYMNRRTKKVKLYTNNSKFTIKSFMSFA